MCGEVLSGDFLSESCDFVELVVEEFLSSESWFDCHDEDGVEFVEDVEEWFDWFAWSDGEAGLCSHGVELACEADWCGGCSHVEGDGGCSHGGVVDCPSVWVFDHEVDVCWECCYFTESLDDWFSDGEVWYEVVVHDVDVDAVGCANGVKFVFEIAEIGGENAWINLNTHCVTLA